MKPRVYFRDSVICYMLCVMYITIFVAATAVNAVTINNESYSGNQKFVGETVNTNEKTRPSYWSALQGNGRNIESPETSKLYATEGTVLFSTNECSRHCIKMDIDKIQDEFQYINLFWSANGTHVTDDILSKNQLITPKRINEQNLNYIPKQCQIYLDLDCEAELENNTYSLKKMFYPNTRSKMEEDEEDVHSDRSNKETLIKIVEKHNLTENTEIMFLVTDMIHRIIINIHGDILNAVLRIPANATVSTPGTAISWTRKTETDGVKIDTRNAPPGEWCMKLIGVGRSNYYFIVEGFIKNEHRAHGKSLFLKSQATGLFSGVPRYLNIKTDVAEIDNKEISGDLTKIDDSKVQKIKRQNLDRTITYRLDHNMNVVRERSLENRSPNEDRSDQIMEETDYSSKITSSTENIVINYTEYPFIDTGINIITSARPSSKEKSSKITFLPGKQQEVHARSSIGLTDSIDVENIVTGVSNGSMSLKMVESLDNQELSEELTSYTDTNTIEERKMLIDVNRNSNLLVAPGTIHRVVFDVMNSCVLPVRYAFRVKSTPFRIYNIQPTYAWIYPGQMSNVAVDLIIPDNAAPDTANTVTLFIQGTEIKEKSVYLYVQGSLSKLTDDVKPTIEYSFNNNCAGKLAKDRCYKSRWSADIKIRDYDSGLKRVISSSNEVYPQTEFISGTRSLITFYYSATCCETTTKITAIDLLDNYNTYTIDVTEWNNLSEAEIAAITVGMLLALLLIIVLVILIIYCVKRRKSHDLPYTQRYGARPPAQAERTNF